MILQRELAVGTANLTHTGALCNANTNVYGRMHAYAYTYVPT